MARKQLGLPASNNDDVITKATRDYMLPSGALASTVPRNTRFDGTGAPLTSGRLTLVACPLEAGDIITSISFLSGTTAATSPTNQWFALYDSSRALLRQTTNDTTTAWAASTVKTLNLTSTYTITSSGLYYLGIMVAATTVPTTTGAAGTTQVYGITPILCGSSTTGLSGTAPNPAAALTAIGSIPLAWAS